MKPLTYYELEGIASYLEHYVKMGFEGLRYAHKVKEFPELVNTFEEDFNDWRAYADVVERDIKRLKAMAEIVKNEEILERLEE